MADKRKQIETEAIHQNYGKLKKGMPTEHMIDSLVADGILSAEYDEDEINLAKTKTEKNGILLRKIMQSAVPDAFTKFVKALKLIPDGNKILADDVQGSYDKLLRDAQNVNKKSESANENVTDSPHRKTEDIDIFLSYCWANQEAVLKIKAHLDKKYRVWMDITKTHAGNVLTGEISRGILNCKAFVPCISKAYKNSDMCKKELSYADDKKKAKIPLIIEDLKPASDLENKDGDLHFNIAGLKYIKIPLVDKNLTTEEIEDKLQELHNSMHDLNIAK